MVIFEFGFVSERLRMLRLLDEGRYWRKMQKRKRVRRDGRSHIYRHRIEVLSGRIKQVWLCLGDYNA